MLSEGPVGAGVLAALGARQQVQLDGPNGEVGHTPQQLVGTHLSKVMDSGCWEELRSVFSSMHYIHRHPSLGPVSPMGGVRDLIWLQIELRCGLFNPAAF